MPNRTTRNTEDRKDRNGHILIVDDERAIRRLAKRVLSTHGYRVTACATGAEAIEAYAKLHAKVDLVILDMLMPKMNGVETLVQLKQMNPAVRAVLCSAFVPDLSGRTIAGEGFVGFIAKPFGLDTLLMLVERHVQ
ncbi:MAG: response regulator [Phycisphaerae bacterium]|jgi:CheY-like chemotaxis protein|nr:response regulator [Phycisphaerae bacterium]